MVSQPIFLGDYPLFKKSYNMRHLKDKVKLHVSHSSKSNRPSLQGRNVHQEEMGMPIDHEPLHYMLSKAESIEVFTIKFLHRQLSMIMEMLAQGIDAQFIEDRLEPSMHIADMLVEMSHPSFKEG